MTEEKKPSTRMTLGGATTLVRFSHLHAFQPRLNDFNGKEEYSVAVLIPKTDTETVKKVKAAIESLKKANWTDKKKTIPPGFWNPLRDGDTDRKQNGNAFGDECKGHYVLNAKSDEAPSVVGTTRDANGKFLRIGPKDVKSGDWGRVAVDLFAYVKGSGGVSAGLSSIQMVREGEGFSSRQSADDAFGGFDDAGDDPLA